MLLIIAILIFALASPYKIRLFNIADSFGLLLFVFKFVVAEYRDILNSIIAASFLLYFIIFMYCKLTLKLNCRYSRKLKAIADKMTVNSNNLHIEREAGDIEDNLPDRMVNPEGYRRLSEVNKEQTTNKVRFPHMASPSDSLMTTNCMKSPSC